MLVLNKFIVILFLFFCSYKSIFPQIGVIYSVDYPDSTEINLGPVFVGDSLDFRIRYKNFTDNTYEIYEVKPTFGIFRYPYEVLPDEFLSYRHISPSFPIKVMPRSEHDILFQFRADTNLKVYPIGWYNADILVGFGIPPDTTVALSRKFHVFTKKTNKYIDGFQDILNFDSVYVNPPVPAKGVWKVRSTFVPNLQVEKQEIKLITPKVTTDEFIPNFYEINPLFIRKRDVVEWEIGYQPRNPGPDTAEVRLYYKDNQNKSDYCRVLLVGTGVQQKLNLINSNYQFRNDTIFLSAVPTNKPIDLEFEILNSSNFAFFSINETLTTQYPFKFNYQINTKLISNNSYLQPNKSSRVRLNLNFQEKGNFVLKYTITSDAANRFKFFPIYESDYSIYIVGRALEPEIQANNNEIDFESIFLYYPYCKSSKDTTFAIRNIGNDTLRIGKIEIVDQKPMSVFSVSESSLNLPPDSLALLHLKFEPVLPQIFSARLILHNNSKYPQYEIELKGVASTPAIAELKIDTHKVRPGTILTIPIKTNKNIVFANEFIDTLYYDRSILHYLGYNLLNTAIDQPIEHISINESLEGKLSIHVRKPRKTSFKSDTILIKLNFATYLGNSKSTTISFKSPKLGNEFCERTLNIISENIRNGVVLIDSICGVDFKAFPRKLNLMAFSFNQDTKILNIKYNILSQGEVVYSIYDYLGTKIYENKSFKETTAIDEDIILPNLPFGFYFLTITFENELIVTKFFNEGY